VWGRGVWVILYIHRLPGDGADMAPACEPEVLASLTNSVANGNTVSDIVALNLEVNTSALNINDQISPDDIGPRDFPLDDGDFFPGTTPRCKEDEVPRPRDFLDLVDSVTTDWNATPTRPRMFPHKLF
jgi:hypothetical protein